MSLKDQILARAREIRTDSYGMSIGEVITLAKDGDIDIHPEFQRIFRWKPEQKSRLIESILLGIPIPPIFVSQREDGVWDVIDGVQRLSTILEFTGNLAQMDRGSDGDLDTPDGDEDEPDERGFVLGSGEYLTDMDGFRWEAAGEHDRHFDDSLRRDFKRAKLEFVIITKGSDPQAKFDLFQRLNSGSVLSQQEARNCLMVMINRDMYQQVRKLAHEEPFTSCVQLSERQEEQAYSQELILRFFVQREFKGGDTELRQEYGEYVTRWMKGKARDGGLSTADVDTFKETFQLLESALGEDAFRRYDGNRHLGPFSISGYEFITSGVSHNLETWKGRSKEELSERVRKCWSQGAFRAWSGTGVSPRRRVPRLVNSAREYFT